MGLDQMDRGYLEKMIDSKIAFIPDFVHLARQEEIRKFSQLQSEDDFVFGLILGSIHENFSNYFTKKHGLMPTDEQMIEQTDVISKRMRDIKEAIFQCG